MEIIMYFNYFMAKNTKFIIMTEAKIAAGSRPGLT